jgi:hypothetical protein
MKKVEQEELENLRTLHQKFNETKIAIADAELSKNKFFRDLESLSKEFMDAETSLVEKYGNVSINLTTGEITDDKN